MLLYSCEQEETIDIDHPFLFIDQQVVFTHVLQDPFAFMLETSEKETLMSCLESICGFGFSKWMSFRIEFNFSLNCH